jgi:FkbM family methyltransferase
MKKFFIKILSYVGIYNRIKLLKERYFKNPVQINIDEKLHNFYSQIIRPGDLCFDVGASYGYRTESFLKLGAKVIAVEPQLQPAKFLKLRFNNNIVLVRKALGNKNDIKPMLISSAGALSSLSENWVMEVKKKRFKSETWKKKINIEVTTLDDLINRYGVPDFCKIDVEGYEYEVLQGLTKPIRLLSFEYTIPEFTDRAIMCINYLSNLGEINCNYSSGESLKFGLDDWQKPDAFILLFKELPVKNIIDGDIYVKFI